MTDIYRTLIQNINYTLMEHGTLGIKCPSGSGIVNKMISHINSSKISCALMMPATVDMVDLADIEDKLLKTSKGKDLVLILDDLQCAPNMLQPFTDMVVKRSFKGKRLNIQASFIVDNSNSQLYDSISKAGLRNFGEYDMMKSQPLNIKTNQPMSSNFQEAMEKFKASWKTAGFPRVVPKSIGGKTSTP